MEWLGTTKGTKKRNKAETKREADKQPADDPRQRIVEQLRNEPTNQSSPESARLDVLPEKPEASTRDELAKTVKGVHAD